MSQLLVTLVFFLAINLFLVQTVIRLADGQRLHRLFSQTVRIPATLLANRNLLIRLIIALLLLGAVYDARVRMREHTALFNPQSGIADPVMDQ